MTLYLLIESDSLRTARVEFRGVSTRSGCLKTAKLLDFEPIP